ncbi:PRC-barrel domain-containing protein [Candidatus Micrarchaeota archaeon]|nr:PRC-barrel domain-containing protein [Candidatus Micrarchaeota archaeon]
MMKPVLGKTLTGKKVVSSSGLDLGYVADATFELGGSLTSIMVKVDHESRDVKDHVDKTGMLNVPYSDVKAVGRYVVVNFPSAK